jgi:RNA polymerase sigma-70 factor (ECF subfamily)
VGHLRRRAARPGLRALGEQGQRELVAAFVGAWERADVTAMVGLLTEDARFSMPPLPASFCGRDDVLRFMTQRMWATPWRLVPVRANAQLAFACYQGHAEAPDYFRLSAINVVTVRDQRIVGLTGFLDPDVHRRFRVSPVAMRLAASVSHYFRKG